MCRGNVFEGDMYGRDMHFRDSNVPNQGRCNFPDSFLEGGLWSSIAIHILAVQGILYWQ